MVYWVGSPLCSVAVTALSGMGSAPKLLSPAALRVRFDKALLLLSACSVPKEVTAGASEACAVTVNLHHLCRCPWFSPEAEQGCVSFSIVCTSPSARLCCGLGVRALWLQESRWLCCCLGLGLPLWRSSPMACLPQIQPQAGTVKGRAVYSSQGPSAGVAFLWRHPVCTDGLSQPDLSPLDPTPPCES